MMNILQVQDALKGLPMDALVREMQMPSGQAPQFLILSEIARRKKMEQEAQQPAPTTTVAQDAVTAAGVPQGGIADVARSMAPKSDVAQNTGIAQRSMQPPPEPQMMASGGYVQKMQPGGPVVRNGMVMAPPYPFEGSRDERDDWLTKYSATHNWDGYPKNTRGQPSVGRDMNAIQSQFDQPEDVTTLDIFEPALSAVAPVTEAFRKSAQQDIPQVDEFSGLGDPLGPQGTFATSLDRALGRGAATAADMTNPADELAGVGGALGSPRVPPGYYSMRDMGAEANALDALTNQFAGVGDVLAGPKAPPLSERDLAALAKQFSESSASVSDKRGEDAWALANEFAGVGDPLAGQDDPLGLGPALEKAAETQRAARAAQTDIPGTGMPLVTPGGIADLAAPSPADEVAPTVTPPGAATAAGAATATAAAGGAGGSPFEKEIMDMLARKEKSAEQDKWLALAQAGMALMASQQPTFGAALGEAGLAGLKSLQSGRAQYDKDRLGLLSALESAKLSREKLAAASKPRLLPDEVLTAFDDEITAAQEALSDTLNPPTPDQRLRLTARLSELLAQKADARRAFFAQYGYSMPTSAAPAGDGVVKRFNVTE